MSMQYCEVCDTQIDTDKDAEHFGLHVDDGECDHPDSEVRMVEILFHPDDTSPTQQHYVRTCPDCGEEWNDD